MKYIEFKGQRVSTNTDIARMLDSNDPMRVKKAEQMLRQASQEFNSTWKDYPHLVNFKIGPPQPKRLRREDGWYSDNDGLSWHNPAPHAEAPPVPNSQTVQVKIVP